jgi:hypothetical protein
VCLVDSSGGDGGVCGDSSTVKAFSSASGETAWGKISLTGVLVALIGSDILGNNPNNYVILCNNCNNMKGKINQCCTTNADGCSSETKKTKRRRKRN